MARRYYPHNTQDVEDLASETMLRAMEAINTYDDSRSLLAWCRTIMRNLFVSEFKHERCLEICSLEDWDCAGETCTDAIVIAGEILSALRFLNRRSVCVVCLVAFAKGYSYSEIAKMYSIPEGTVRSRINAARKELAMLIKR
jgi:RNA polymerase sigma-70 factor (ECF subfamily)